MKFKTQQEIDNYLRENEKKFEDSNVTLEELSKLIKEQNKILEEWIKLKCQEIRDGECNNQGN